MIITLARIDDAMNDYTIVTSHTLLILESFAAAVVRLHSGDYIKRNSGKTKRLCSLLGHKRIKGTFFLFILFMQETKNKSKNQEINHLRIFFIIRASF